tara:strand:- start:3797 stop:4303 length:507 start_codon:yes stop_codon:yes gene_type:complete
MRKPSFFEKLTGSIAPDSYDDLFESEEPKQASALVHDAKTHHSLEEDVVPEPEEEPVHEGELSVDIYQTPDMIVVKALIAGVSPNSVDISLTRDMITIRGNREEHKETSEENYFYRELYWGAFARTILLPEEVDVDAADATTNHGILVIRLPKINKERKTKLKVKSSA